jgi:predicted nucleotidyltransferase component of viral defense system
VEFSVKLTIDFVVETTLTAIYSQNIFSENLYLKGGQALRIKENLRNRFSADIDFSTPTTIGEHEIFFEMIEAGLNKEYYEEGYYVFDFKFSRKPKYKKEGTPDFWGGWGFEYKVVENSKRNDPLENLRREALVPEGATSPAIRVDISEYEYCGSVERIKVKSTNIRVYSRALLLLEKIRAICQQHPDYKYKSGNNRSRDYYDIERLWSLVLTSNNPEDFIKECSLHIEKVFLAKGVSLVLLEKIFDPSFIEIQKSGWISVVTTVKGNLKEFSYYNESLRLLIKDIKGNLPR